MLRYYRENPYKGKKISEPDNIWRFHDFLTEKRQEIDGRYDYRYSKLIIVFAKLISERWIDFSDLEGLEEEKIDRIESLINFWNE